MCSEISHYFKKVLYVFIWFLECEIRNVIFLKIIFVTFLSNSLDNMIFTFSLEARVGEVNLVFLPGNENV